jgi:hypothetical protein
MHREVLGCLVALYGTLRLAPPVLYGFPACLPSRVMVYLADCGIGGTFSGHMQGLTMSRWRAVYTVACNLLDGSNEVT